MSTTPTKTRRPGRPRTIDRESVLAAAMQQAGTDLNVMELADSIGTTIAAIYRLFGDKPRLLAAMYGKALADLRPISGSHWAEWLDDYALLNLELTRRYPFIAAQRFNQGDLNAELIQVAERTLAMIEPGITKLIRAGLAPDVARAALNTVSMLVVEHVRSERIQANATVDISSVTPPEISPEDTLWKILKVLRRGLEAEMRTSKEKKK